MSHSLIDTVPSHAHLLDDVYRPREVLRAAFENERLSDRDFVGAIRLLLGKQQLHSTK